MNTAAQSPARLAPWAGVPHRTITASSTTHPVGSVGHHVEGQIAAFRALTKSQRQTIRAEARDRIERHPGAADNSDLWRGLSARQIISA